MGDFRFMLTMFMAYQGFDVGVMGAATNVTSKVAGILVKVSHKPQMIMVPRVYAVFTMEVQCVMWMVAKYIRNVEFML